MRSWLAGMAIMTLVACSQQSSSDNFVVGRWSMSKVVSASTGELAPENVYKGIVYTFNEDGSAKFQQSGDFGNKDFEGTWALVGDTIKLEYEQIKSVMVLERKNEKELVWTIPDNTKWKFYFQRSRQDR